MTDKQLSPKQIIRDDLKRPANTEVEDEKVFFVCPDCDTVTRDWFCKFCNIDWGRE